MRAGQRVERAERLVHQQHARLDRQRAGDADALLHAAGDLARQLVLRRQQADKIERGAGALGQLGALFRRAENPLHRQVHVLEAGQPGQQRVVLEHHGAVRAGPGDFALGAQQHAAGRAGQAGDQVQQGGLAAAGMADQGDELALLHRQVDVAQRDEGALAGGESLAHAFDAYEFLHGATPRCR